MALETAKAKKPGTKTKLDPKSLPKQVDQEKKGATVQPKAGPGRKAGEKKPPVIEAPTASKLPSKEKPTKKPSK